MNNPIHKTIEVRCAQTHAFDTFVNHIDLWWPPTHKQHPNSTMALDATVGGAFEERTPDGQIIQRGEVLSCEPPEHIQYTWHPGKITHPTLVDIHFEIISPTHTLVRVIHSEGDANMGEQWPKRATRFDASWDDVLNHYQQHLIPN